MHGICGPAALNMKTARHGGYRESCLARRSIQNGKVHRAAPGKLFVTNSESIHKVISDEGTLGIPEVIAVVLLVNVDFVKKLVPNLEQMYFLPEADSDMEKIEQLMKELKPFL